jgi:hypothetical protein
VKIAMTPFALRHWDPASKAAQIEGLSAPDLVELCSGAVRGGSALADGYAPFCKHLFLENPSEMRCAFAPITDRNRHLLRHGYVARREGELAVLERWFEGVDAPRARFLDVILYSHAQLVAEAKAYPEHEDVPDCDWGIVAIIGTLEAIEPPMPPITQMRNALGRSEGGSGVPIDRQKYAAAVVFWDHHAAVKP